MGMSIAAAVGFTVAISVRLVALRLARVGALLLATTASKVLFVALVTPVALGIIVAFGAVTNADAGAKATLLARGLSELVRCTPFVLPAGLGAAAAILMPTPRSTSSTEQ